MKPETSSAFRGAAFRGAAFRGAALLGAPLLGLVLGMAATTADGRAADATCRDLDNGAVSRVCRWPVGSGNTVDVWYGVPSNRAAAQPVQPPPNYPPQPTYYEPAYYDDWYGYGYGWGYPYLPVVTDSRAWRRQLGPDPRLRAFRFVPGPQIGMRGGVRAGFPGAGFQGAGFQGGGFQGAGFRGGAGGGRR